MFSGNNYCEDCKETKLGTRFCGQISITRSGKTCQRWDSQHPHKHGRKNPLNFPDKSLEDAGSYCRNPDRESQGPWCYTLDPNSRWEYCEVNKCGKYINNNVVLFIRIYGQHVILYSHF